jgi:hypothetical protein
MSYTPVLSEMEKRLLANVLEDTAKAARDANASKTISGLHVAAALLGFDLVPINGELK